MGIVAKAFHAVRPGNVFPEVIAIGEEVEGRLEQIAREIGALVEDAEKAMKAAPSNKSVKGAPETK